MADLLEHEIRSKLLSARLGISARSVAEENLLKNVFKDLEKLVGTVIQKHKQVTGKKHSDIHEIIDVWPMTRTVLQKLHESIFRRLKSTPLLSSPWYYHFTRDVPKEVFSVILRVLERTSFGHTKTETNAFVNITVFDRRKAVYLFNAINEDGCIVDKKQLLTREYPDDEIAMVIVSAEKPFELKYSKNSEILGLTFYYGFWNSSGIPQHQ